MGNFVIFGIFEQALSQDGVISVGRVTNLVDLVFLLQEKHFILLAQDDWQPFPPSMKVVLLGFSCSLSSWVIFVIFFVSSSTSSLKMGSLVLRRVTNLVDLVVLLQGKHLILLPHHACHPLPPSMKNSAFCVSTLFVILHNILVYLSTRSPRWSN